MRLYSVQENLFINLFLNVGLKTSCRHANFFSINNYYFQKAGFRGNYYYGNNKYDIID